MKWTVSVLFFLLILSIFVAADKKDEKPKPAQSIDWESTDPIRVVHVLEHTTVCDDRRFREYAKQAPASRKL